MILAAPDSTRPQQGFKEVANLQTIPLIGKPFNWVMRTVQFFKEVWAELNKVVWPSKAETWAYTLVVLVAVAVVAAYIGLLDIVFNWLVMKLQIYR